MSDVPKWEREEESLHMVLPSPHPVEMTETKEEPQEGLEEAVFWPRPPHTQQQGAWAAPHRNQHTEKAVA